MRHSFSWLFGLSLLMSGCSCGGLPPATCSYGGSSHPVGSSFPSTDGCNTCSCLAGGAVACTERACLPSDGGTSGDASVPSDGGGDVVMCTASPVVFPSFDKTCTSDSQCSFGLHQTNCCGSLLAIGWNVAESARFAADEKLCRTQYPPCACPAAPTKTEDGQTWDGVKTIVATCTAKGCQTTLK